MLGLTLLKSLLAETELLKTNYIITHVKFTHHLAIWQENI
jgi:hypothetical protein